MSYSIVPASVRHIRPMSQCMRSAAAVALDGYGFNPREALRRAFVGSFHCRTALIDDKPAAMWGVAGPLLGNSAYVWLVLSEEIRRMPRAIVREAKAELERVMDDRREVLTTVLPEDGAAIRFALYLGFRGDEEDDDVEHDILTNPKYRIPVGDRYLIRLGYHPNHLRRGH